MDITILLSARCVVCGYTTRGMVFTSGRPGMRSVRLRAGPALAIWPDACAECRHPTGQPAREQFDPETVASLEAWQERQRGKRRQRPAQQLQEAAS